MSLRTPTLALAILVGALALTGGPYAQETAEGQEQAQQPSERPRVEPPPAPDGIEGFGAVDWGMSTEDVARYYPDAKRLEEGGLSVSMAIGGKPTEAYFIFKDGKLAIIAGRFTQRYSSLNNYVHEYDAVVRILKRELSDPIYTEVKWADDGIEQDEREMGRAVATGRLRLRTRWETSKTYVDFRCTGGNYQVHRSIKFQSKELGGTPQKPKAGS